MIKAGIIGGAGYTAGELLRILVNHPNVEITSVHSRSNAGKFLYQIHTDLLGETELKFSETPDFNVDVLFLCVGHGEAEVFLKDNPVPHNVKIIDLSQDFRIKDKSRGFVYGLPELNKAQIKEASKIANPGCFATCIQLALLPLAKAGKIADDVHVNAVTGSTGAGQSPTATSHFSWRTGNVSVYKAFNHQHLREINQSVKQLQADFAHEVNFIPVRGAFPRGIFATAYLKTDLSQEEALQLYRRFYQDQPFVVISEQNPDLKQVVNTNKCLLYLEKCGDKLLIISMIDNLLKGASGQAVQNMNLIFGLEETTGLKLKSIGF